MHSLIQQEHYQTPGALLLLSSPIITWIAAKLGSFSNGSAALSWDYSHAQTVALKQGVLYNLKQISSASLFSSLPGSQ